MQDANNITLPCERSLVISAIAYDLFLVLLHICLNDIYDETLLTWQSDICSIFHMVSTFHCIASNLVKCLLLSLHIIVLVIPSVLFFIHITSSYMWLSNIKVQFVCITHQFVLKNKIVIRFSCRLDLTWHRERGRNTEWQGMRSGCILQILLVLMVQ